jgi:tetratricopeptide (TPR) repeat protein
MLPLAKTCAGVVLLTLGCVVLSGCAGTGDERPAEATQTEDDPKALIVIAELALERKQYLEAAQTYRRAAELSDDEDVAEQATQIAFEHHQTTEMYRAANRWLELNPTSEEARRFAGFAAIRLYRVDPAVEHFDYLLNNVFINPQAGFLALLPQMLEEESRSAVTATFQQLAERHPDIGEAHYALAQAALRSENLELAARSAQRAVELSPYWSPAGMLRSRVELAQGKSSESLATAREVVERDPQLSNRLELALIELAAEEEENGRNALADLAQDDEAGPAAERALALLALQDDDLELASERFEALLRQGRFVYESLFHLGAIAESRGNASDAIGMYSRVVGGDYAVAAQTRVARLKRENESLESGLAHLEQFAATRPAFTLDMIGLRAALLDGSGDSEAAVALLDDAIAAYPDAVALQLQQSFLLERLDRVSSAVDLLEKLHAGRPADPVVMNALGYTLVDRTRRHKEGHDLIAAALADSPDSGAILDSMGWSLYKLREYDEALEYLERARARIADPEVDLHIGEVEWALGQREAAITTWQAAIERYPDDADLKQRLERAEDAR